MESWETYYKNSGERQPREILADALPLVQHRDAALDIGAGAMIESRLLVAEGFREVDAVESSPAAASRFVEEENQGINFINAPIENFELPENKYDLVNATYSLFFLNKTDLEELVQTKILRALKSGGVFCGQLMGANDDAKRCTLCTKEEAAALFRDYSVVTLSEEEHDTPSVVDKTPRHWHLFHFIVQKP